MLEAATMTVHILANHISSSSLIAPGAPIVYPNDLDIASDGTIYFTASVDIYPARNAQFHSRISSVPSLYNTGGFYDTVKVWGLGMCHGHPTGFVGKYDPKTREAVVISDGWWYPNGIALSKDEDYLAVCETDRVRIMKIWLKGPKASGAG
jgi:sugar lactone lactonase YvrE